MTSEQAPTLQDEDGDYEESKKVVGKEGLLSLVGLISPVTRDEEWEWGNPENADK